MLTKYTDMRIGGYQQVFREIRSTILTQTIETCYEHKYIVFIDFRQASDTVSRSKIEQNIRVLKICTGKAYETCRNEDVDCRSLTQSSNFVRCYVYSTFLYGAEA